MLFEPYVRFHIFIYVWTTECPPIGKMAAHSAHFWSGDFFLIAPFPDHCLLVPKQMEEKQKLV